MIQPSAYGSRYQRLNPDGERHRLRRTGQTSAVRPGDVRVARGPLVYRPATGPVLRIGRDDVLEAVLLRRADAPPSDPWQRLPADVARRETWCGAEVFALPKGRLLVGESARHWYVVDPVSVT